MVDERMVGKSRPVSAPVGPHDEIVFFAIYLAVRLIKQPELSQNLRLDIQAEASRGRQKVEIREVSCEGSKAAIGVFRRRSARLGLLRQRADAGIVGACAHETDHGI